MKSLNEISTCLRNHRFILETYHVENLWVFGSVAKGVENPNDLDILVEFNTSPSLVEYIKLKEQLTELLSVKVDLISRKGCKSAFLNEIEADLKHVA